MSDILAQPNPLYLATGVEGLLEVGGSALIPGLPEGLQAAWFNISPNLIINGTYNSNIQKIGGVSGVYSEMLGVRRVPKQQPFEVYGAFNEGAGNDLSLWIGARDNLGRNYGVEVYRYAPETDFYFHVYHEGVTIESGLFDVTGNNEGFRMNLEGDEIVYYHHSAGQFNPIYRRPIGVNVIDFRFLYMVAFNGDRILSAHCRIDDAIVPLNTSNINVTFASGTESNISIRAVDISHFGVRANNILNDILVLKHPDVEGQTAVPTRISNLYLRPSDRPCGSYVIENETIQFETNGGFGGIFEASGGTILNSLRWQAPSSVGVVDFSYQVESVVATCQLNVVPKLEVNGVRSDGFYPDLAQGEAVQFVATCPDAVFSLEVPIPEIEPDTEEPDLVTIMTRGGYMVAPTDANDPVFGAKNLTVKVTGCGQVYRFRVHIQAMYPTPKFCGPTPIHWRPPLIPDYLPNISTMTGGTRQVKNRNAEGILMWDVTYDNMLQDTPTNCTCVTTDIYHRSSCDESLAIAGRLDSFYKQVSMAKYFTVLDYQTEMMYKYVRLTAYDGNHNLYANEQSRQLQMKQEGDVLFD